MSQFARNNPELYESGVTYEDVHTDLADLDPDPYDGPCEVCGFNPNAPHGCACDAPGADKEEAQ